VFPVDDRSAPVVKFQHFQAFGGPGVTFENRSASSTLVVDNDGSHAAQTRSGRIALRAGPHPLTVGYQQGAGEFLPRVEVEGPGLSRRVLPAVK